MLNPPKKIFEKLANVNSTNQIYSEVLDKLKKLILEKCRNELERAKTKQTIDITNEHMRRFESAVKYLPESMENALEIELQHCKGDIKRLVQYSELKLQDSSITEKIDKINNCSFEYQNLQVIKSDFNKELNMYINDIETIYVEVHVDIICIFEDAYQHFLNQILTVHQTKHVKTRVVMLKKDVTCLFGLMKFRNDVQNGQISNFILPEDFDEKMTRLSEKLGTYSIEQAKN
ncbi:unnamed protein product [Rotaria magnacalcarata]|uniref:Uncharacterized protein n=4 Tax=Rotaria magnacalcarata TaxID=392030 RepID=A0A820TKF5_9BILA|nr:unnamed protein product [Rotaria magnacalcarata]